MDEVKGEKLNNSDINGDNFGYMEGFSLSSFEPFLLRPVPPLYESKEEEVIWLNPEEDLELLWDHSMGTEKSNEVEMKELMLRAFKQTLTQEQAKEIAKELEQNPKFVYHCGLTPRKLPDLVENNPVIAIEVLLKLMSSNQITEYKIVFNC